MANESRVFRLPAGMSTQVVANAVSSFLSSAKGMEVQSAETAVSCRTGIMPYREQRRRHRRKSAGSVRKRKRPRLRRLLHKLRPRLTVRYAPRAARPLPRA